MNHIKQTMLSLPLALLSSCANPMSGLQFACDPDDPSTCISGYVCVKAEPGHKYKGVCKPAQEADIPRDSGGYDAACVPSCSGKECGPDGCGGSCGECSGGKQCFDGSCVCVAFDHQGCCGNAVCWFDSCGEQGAKVTDCAHGCKDAACQNCFPSCTGKECGDDGCGGSCGDCSGGKQCIEGTCVCVPFDHRGCCGDAVCWFDSCGQQGQKVADCEYGCKDGKCQSCVPSCSGKECGDDGCGGSCGSCPAGTSCESGTCQSTCLEVWGDEFTDPQTFFSQWIADWHSKFVSKNIISDSCYSGSTCLYVEGKLNQCWAGGYHRKLGVSLPFRITVAVRHGNEALNDACHNAWNEVALFSEIRDYDATGFAILDLRNDGVIYGGTTSLGWHQAGQWYLVQMLVSSAGTNKLEISYVIDGTSRGNAQFDLPSGVDVPDLLFQLGCANGTCAFDALTVEQCQ